VCPLPLLATPPPRPPLYTPTREPGSCVYTRRPTQALLSSVGGRPEGDGPTARRLNRRTDRRAERRTNGLLREDGSVVRGCSGPPLGTNKNRITYPRKSIDDLDATLGHSDLSFRAPDWSRVHPPRLRGSPGPPPGSEPVGEVPDEACAGVDAEAELQLRQPPRPKRLLSDDDITRIWTKPGTHKSNGVHFIIHREIFIAERREKTSPTEISPTLSPAQKQPRMRPPRWVHRRTHADGGGGSTVAGRGEVSGLER